MTRRLTLPMAAAGLLALALLVANCAVNPATGKRQLSLIGEAQEIEMGRQADEQLSAALGVYPDEALQRYVDAIGQRMAAASERPELPWTFRVVEDPMVNAFALPGGFIYVTRGILAHFNSEAELATVLGHEIGHVTARHSVHRISRAQLATLGLGAAMIVSEDVREYGQLAEIGMGLVFLKFSRDDERQADDLGLRYMVADGYDPRAAPEVFDMLGRVSEAAGAGRIPSWLATHPAPENRSGRLLQQIEELPEEQRQGRVDRASYLRRLDGLTYGPNPREGFFEESVFYHPDLAFRMSFPTGWKTDNRRQEVVALSPADDAAVVLSLAAEATPDEAVRAFFARPGIQRGGVWRSGFYHFRTVPQAGTRQQEMRGIAGFFDHDGRVFHLLGVALAEQWRDHQGAVTGSLGSFARLTDRRYLDVEPARLEIVELPRAMTLAEAAERFPSTVDLATLALLNGLEPGERLEAGRPIKRVVGGKLP